MDASTAAIVNCFALGELVPMGAHKVSVIDGALSNM